MKKMGFALLGLALAATLSIAADARSSAGPMTAMYWSLHRMLLY
jgi:hypothetical protein